MKPDEAAQTQVVDDAFRRLDTVVSPSVVGPPAMEIVARARRRRTAHLLLAAVAVLAVLAGAYTATGNRLAGPPSNVPGESGPVTATPTRDRTQAAKIPDGFLLHEWEAEDVIENHSYSKECFGEPVMRRGSMQFVGPPATRVNVTQSLYVYRDENTAKSVMGNLWQRLRACSGFPDAQVLQDPASPPWGDEAATITLALPADGAGEHTGAPVRYVVVRVGAAIAEVSGFPEIPQIDEDAQAIGARLCYYDADCAPRAGRAAALSNLTSGGSAWAAVIGVIKPTDPKPLPGVSIAAAAELGYHATIVPTACDADAGFALGLTGSANRYVVVYFARQDDAQEFVNAMRAKVFAPSVPHVDLVIGVSTYCV